MPQDSPSSPVVGEVDPDAALMLEVRDGSTEAFRILVSRYQDAIVSLMVRILGRSADAEDLAQDVFIRIYRARARYEPMAKFSTWLFTVANRVALNAIRSRKRRPKVQLTVEDSGGHLLSPEAALVEDGQPRPEARIENRERAEAVREAVARLPDSQRMAVELNKFHGQSYAEIGQAMDLSAMAVKSLLARARTNLRQMLEPLLK